MDHKGSLIQKISITRVGYTYFSFWKITRMLSYNLNLAKGFKRPGE